MKAKSEIKVTYIYVEPKTEEEKKEQEQKINHVFDLLFEATLRSDEWKKYKADKERNNEAVLRQ